ncbi:Ribonuclease S-7 [Gracilariopsis chorda]|uniref:Ribonuclease S-7 n=1 Tax=Gracilariopsis chorda TaxID=448386 RepID=A0A2V3IFI5_9FLOR|nr:Ribonuclease S-7 [Gracilariopsis chorda]|eukprot:PXF40788.1 Ribonuclease S-7 [Gracilariopsis chorda]
MSARVPLALRLLLPLLHLLALQQLRVRAAASPPSPSAAPLPPRPPLCPPLNVSAPPPTRVHFELYVLSLHWPFSVCSRPTAHSALCHYPPPTFTIGGLWPLSTSRSAQPTCCARSFSLSTIFDIAPALRRYWPDFEHADEAALWRTQWVLHGSCSGLGLRTYFKKVLELSRRYDFVRALNSHGVVASTNKAHAFELVQNALNEATGGYRVRMRCEKALNHTVLHAVHVCLHNTRFDTINCPHTCVISTNDSSQQGCCDPSKRIYIPYWSHASDSSEEGQHDAAMPAGQLLVTKYLPWLLRAFALLLFLLVMLYWLCTSLLRSAAASPSRRASSRTQYARISG